MRHLALDPQWLSTRRENSKPGESRRQRVDEISNRGYDVLAVVDHEQHIAFGQPAGERIFVGLPARPRQSELNRHLGRNEIGRPQRAEPNDGHAAGKLPCTSRRNRHRERGLAHASRSQQGRDGSRSNTLGDVPKLTLSADQPPRAQYRLARMRPIRARLLGNAHTPVSPTRRRAGNQQLRNATVDGLASPRYSRS